MYDSYYGFSQAPFGLSPDVYFCYPHRSYLRAKAYMQYALHRGEGFVVVTGRPGTGKTTLIQDLLRDLGSRHQLVARIDSTQLDADDLLRLVTYSFGLKSQGFDKATLIQSLREFLLGRTAVDGKAILIVDEAQNLSSGALEELRLITNLQHGAKPLAQIFLIGQETLRDLVRHPSLEQLHQRIVAACHLEPLDLLETRAYIRHRLLLAGWSGNPVYTADALRLIFEASGGVPRLINKVCDRLMLHGSLEECSTLTGEDTRLVLREFREEFLERIDDGNPDLVASDRSLADLPPIDDLRAESPAPAQTPEAAPASQAPRTHEQANDDDSERPEASDPGLSDGVLEQKPPPANPDAFGAPDAQRDWEPQTREASDQPDRRSTQVDNAQRPLPFVPAEPDGAAIQSKARNSGQASKARDGTGESPGAPKRAPIAIDAAARIEGKKRRRWPYSVAAGLLAIAGLAYLLHHYGQGRLSVPDLWERAESLLGRVAVSDPDPEAGGGVALRPSEQREEPRQPTRAPQQSAAIGSGESRPPSDAGPNPRLPESTAPAISGTFMAAPSAAPDEPGPLNADLDRATPGQQAAGAVGSDVTGLGLPTGDASAGVSAQPASEAPVGHSGPAAPSTPGTTFEPKPAGAATAGVEPDVLPPGSGTQSGVAPAVNEPANSSRPLRAADEEPTGNGVDTGVSMSFDDRTEPPAVSVDRAEARSGDAAALESGWPAAGEPAVDVDGTQSLGTELRELGYDVRENGNGRLLVDLGKEVRFASDSAEVPPEAYRVLQELADLFSRKAETRVTIIGHTDDSGPEEYNRYLSLRRAQNVETYFKRQGLPETRLSSLGLGEDSPLSGIGSDGTSGSNQRRIEILLEPISDGP